MHTRILTRDNEEILINDYSFEWYEDNQLVRSGLVDDTDDAVAFLLDDGFILQDLLEGR